MFKYVIKRIVYFIPTLAIIALVTFALSKMAPGDPVKLALGNKDTGGEAGQAAEKIASEKAYAAMAEKMGLHLPAFYFSITTGAVPDTIYRYIKRSERETLLRLIDQYGNWEAIEQYYRNIRRLQYSIYEVKQDSSTYQPGRILLSQINQLFQLYRDQEIIASISSMQLAAQQSPAFAEVKNRIFELESSYRKVKSEATPFKNYIPAFHFYGINNQFHRWLFGDKPWFFGEDKPGQSAGFLRGDFGFSYTDKRPVWSKMKDALPWTLLLNFISILLAYTIAIPLGVMSARYKGSTMDNVSTFTLFLLNSLPVFWVATLLIMFFTTPEYGMNWFPNYGLGEVTSDMNWLDIFIERGAHLVLPVFCLTYGSWAYLSRQMRGGVLAVFRQDYIRTARAKGLPESRVVWKHAFRNSLIPIITIFASIFPAAIAGSFVIENIFAIPGMGKLSYEALFARDYPLVFTVMLLSAILTLIGNLVADILYAVVDPRISFSK
ncbi:MAG: ABC transporter permease [Chitinophagales bacterium]|nr:ABC transporter permease [Chitinophagales bacterium]MDW8418006.1 ABC transporter permease [Chitinophagales bacterium]